MFGCCVAGRPVQTNYEQIDEAQIVFHLPSASNINHICVFLLGTSTSWSRSSLITTDFFAPKSLSQMAMALPSICSGPEKGFNSWGRESISPFLRRKPPAAAIDLTMLLPSALIGSQMTSHPRYSDCEAPSFQKPPTRRIALFR